MLTILFSYGKPGEEGRIWEREIAQASTPSVRFVPFNHRTALENVICQSALQLDSDYRASKRKLMRLYRDLDAAISSSGAQVLFVTNDQPYHPDFLLKLRVYRAYQTTDDPGATYTRTIPYVHAFHHMFHCALPYSPDKTLREKLLECGARQVDFLPLGAFDFEMDPAQTAESILSRPRDIDFIYVGNPFFSQKFEGFLKLTRAFGSRLKIFGFWKAKHCAYLSVHARQRIWVRPVSLEERVRLYQRAKIGFNIHWDAWGLGNQRLYHLPANGVMQICDSTEHLGEIFEKGREVVPAQSFDEMVELGHHYIARDEERRAIALAGFRRTQSEYRIREVLHRLATALSRGMAASGFRVI